MSLSLRRCEWRKWRETTLTQWRLLNLRACARARPHAVLFVLYNYCTHVPRVAGPPLSTYYLSNSHTIVVVRAVGRSDHTNFTHYPCTPYSWILLAVAEYDTASKSSPRQASSPMIIPIVYAKTLNTYL
ncbi:hypothetical protein EVAR_18236_1 [Eumeta japonica]|uniref:Uncharacterized protein n=1 Tax=Eumeta variegata TaxID=151549 RepID=A0A4C1UJU6_EUMVA|nr:hypothetical protein EVAR_18236_1 [Eumeta japonica]